MNRLFKSIQFLIVLALISGLAASISTPIRVWGQSSAYIEPGLLKIDAER